jgi:hypothetical protein
MSLAVGQNDDPAFTALAEMGVAVVVVDVDVVVVVAVLSVVAEVELGWSQRQPDDTALCLYFSCVAQH